MTVFKTILAACLLWLTACGGATQTDTNQAVEHAASQVSTAEPTFEPAGEYAVFFELGRSWTYQAAHTTAFWDELDPDADEHGTVRQVREWQFTCTVADLSYLPGAAIATLDCGDQGELIPEVLVATAQGLWGGHAAPDSDIELTFFCATEPLLSSSPVEFDIPEEDEDGAFGSNTILVHDENGAWVWTSSAWGGDEQWDGFTLLPGVGFTDFETGWAGGSEMMTTIHLIQ